MRDKARVVKMEQAVIWVVPLLTDTCISCGNAGCAKQGSPFAVSNPRNLPLHVGSIVKIAAPLPHQAAQAAAALGLPVLAAAAGYAAPALFMPSPPETVRVGALLAAFLAVALAVLAVNRRRGAKKTAEITELAETGAAPISSVPGSGCP